MRLSDLDFQRLLPPWMRGDAADLALSGGVDETLRRVAPQLSTLTVWDAIDRLPEAYLDELAWALDVWWYMPDAPLETKRGLIRNSDRVHQKLGTVTSVESVVSDYFGTGRVREWFEYEGLPHHFKVFTTEPSAVNENLQRFLTILERVKRKSSKFDGIQIGLTGEQHLHVGVANRNTTLLTAHFGTKEQYWDLMDYQISPSCRTVLHTGVRTVRSDVMTIRLGSEEEK